jgi:predicted Zn-dependent protease
MLGNLGGGAVGAASGNRRLGDIARVAIGSPTESVQRMNVRFNPEEEYVLGRAVAANAIAEMGLDPDEGRQRYVRLVGQSLVLLSTRLNPTFNGYTFAVLDSDEVNGVSGPGGFVMVTRGAVKACKTEDELAAILCHEMAHVSLKHAEAVLRQGPTFRAEIGKLAGIAAAAAGAGDSGYRQGLVDFFAKITTEATQKALEHSYGSDYELKADEEACYLLWETGYEAAAMRDVLRTIASLPGQHGGATHAAPADRAAALERVVATYGGRTDAAGKAARAARFRN